MFLNYDHFNQHLDFTRYYLLAKQNYLLMQLKLFIMKHFVFLILD